MTRTMKRRLRRYAITTVIAVAPLAVLCAYVSNLLVPTEPLPKPVYYSVVPTAGIDESNETIGIADSDMYDPRLTEADIIKRFDEMQALGVDTLRVLVPWGVIRPVEQGNPWEAFFPPDWSRIDFIVDQAMSRDMGVLGVLASTPYYGGQNGAGCFNCFGVAPDPEKFAAFAAEAALRYKGEITAYEIGNEPNLYASWLPAPDAVAYTNVLKAAYTAIKEAYNDPTVPDPTVVAGVLIAATNWMPVTMDARDFVEQMYANGAKGFFDALSFHPYQYTTKFSEGAYDPAVNPHEPWKANSPLEMLLAIRQTMLDYDDGALRIWATEYGLPTAGLNAVTPEDQAEFIADFLDAWDDVVDVNGDEFTGPAYIYTIIDRMDGTEDGSFGLFTKDAFGNWVRKPAADAVQDAINPGPGPGPGPGPDPGQAIAQALAQLAQALADAWANAIAQALADLFAVFNPPAATATALAVPAEESGVATLSMSELTTGTDVPDVAGDETVAAENAEPADVATEEVPAEEVPTEEVPTEEVPTEEVPTVDVEVTEPEVTEAVTEEVGSEVPVEETEVPAEETETVTEESEVVESEEPTAAEESARTPGTRKETEDEADVSKKDADKKPEDGTKADGATSGGKHEAGNVTNGTSVNEIKERLASETAAPDAAADAGAAAA